MANTYWHIHPRNFANECKFIVASDDKGAQILTDQEWEKLKENEFVNHLQWLRVENSLMDRPKGTTPVDAKKWAMSGDELEDAFLVGF